MRPVNSAYNFVDMCAQAILECHTEYGVKTLIKQYTTQFSLMRIYKLSSTSDLTAVNLYVNKKLAGDYAISKYRETELNIPITINSNDMIMFHGDKANKVIISFNVRVPYNDYIHEANGSSDGN